MNSNLQPEEPPALVIGDTHGKYHRLRALLEQEGIIDENGIRINTDVEVIQVGDLGDFRKNSLTGDKACFEAVRDGLIDVLLWGNHDRSVRDNDHQFDGFHQPGPTMSHIIKAMEVSKKIRWAYATHGYLITHAGLHAAFENMDVPEGLDKSDPYDVADYLNQDAEKYKRLGLNSLKESVCKLRGGLSYWGGILWRDYQEPLYDAFPQIFGHSSAHVVREINDRSYCIDLSKHQALGAIWLPDKRIVRIDDDG